MSLLMAYLFLLMFFHYFVPVPPLFVIEFLHRAVDIFQDYFHECNESSIKEHIVIVYEVAHIFSSYQ